MKLLIELDSRHIEIFKHFASMRRTLTEATQIILEQDRDTEQREACADELEQITPVIEAAQFAIRNARSQP